jgi:hypothetical protein
VEIAVDFYTLTRRNDESLGTSRWRVSASPIAAQIQAPGVDSGWGGSNIGSVLHRGDGGEFLWRQILVTTSDQYTPTHGDHVSYQYRTSDHDSNPDVGTYANPDPNAAADPGAQVYGNAHSCAWGGCACRVFF